MAFGTDLPKSNGDDTFELPIPAAYVIDTDKTIRMAFADADYTKRLDPEQVIERLKNMKLT